MVVIHREDSLLGRAALGAKFGEGRGDGVMDGPGSGITGRFGTRSAFGSKASLGVPDSAHLALFFGRLDEQKGVSTLLDAARLVAPELPGWHLACEKAATSGTICTLTRMDRDCCVGR